MTGVTLQLARWQVDELRVYLPGQNKAVPSRNLLRRGMVEPAGGGFYRITPFGRESLAAAG